MPDWRRLPWELRYRKAARAASRLRQLSILATHRHCHVEFQGPVHLGPGFSLNISGPGSFVVGPGVEFRRGFHCEISGSGRVTIGTAAVFTFGPLIQCTTSIDIEDEVAVGQAVLIVDGTHKWRDYTQSQIHQGYDYQPIRIGRRAAIGAKATVFADIGERAVVAAHAVVAKPVPAFCLAGGVPARVIEYFGPPELRPPELDGPHR